MTRDKWTMIGFLIFFVGFISIVLSLVGLRLSFIAFLDQISIGFSFLVHIIMVFSGVIIMYISRTSQS